MKLRIILAIGIFSLFSINSKAQSVFEDFSYQNPLGFYPLELHAANGFILPALAVGACLLFTQKDSSLNKKLKLYGELNPSWGSDYPFTFIPQCNLGMQYPLRKYLTIGLELGSVFPQDAFNQTVGVDLRPFARFYPIRKKHFKYFFECGCGLLFTLDKFPKPTDQDDRLGLQLNGITKYGIGMEILFSDKCSGQFGVRHLHISNGNIQGVERNPSHDSNGLFLGLIWEWK